MSYTVFAGLGYDFTIGTPVGDMNFSIPIEKLAEDAGMMALNAAAPLAVNELKKALPDFLLIAQPFLRKEVDNALNKAKIEGTKIESGALQQAGKLSALIILGVFGAAFLTRRTRS